jgi:ferredoxin
VSFVVNPKIRYNQLTNRLRGIKMEENAIPIHYVCTPEQAWQLVQEHQQFWVSNCYCRESRGHCARSRMDVCLIFNDALSGSGSGKKAVTLADVQAILVDARTKHLVPRPYRDDSRTVTDGICFCCDDCCSYFLNPEEACDKGSLIEATNLEACQTCGDCVDVCYFEARSLEAGLVINQERCYGCGLCVEACPEEAIRMVERER